MDATRTVPTWGTLFAPRGLLLCALATAVGAMLGRECGVVGAALAGSIALGWCAVRRRLGPIACALPAALGALSFEPAPWPQHPAGTVRFEGDVIRSLPQIGRGSDDFRLVVDVAARGDPPREMLCVVSDAGDTRATYLPGDRLAGVAWLRDGPDRRAAGRAPLLETRGAAMVVTPGGSSPARLLDGLRRRLTAALFAPTGGEAGALLCHLVLGSGPPLADDLVHAHRGTGLAHLLAVSGAHASLLAWMLACGYGMCTGRDPGCARRFRWTCALLLLGYGAITGFEPPIVRALAAWGLIGWAAAHGRRPTVCATLALPMAITAVLTPDDLFGLSFVLSYAAVLGLAVAPRVSRGRPWARTRSALWASAWATWTTAPCTLAWFGQLAPWTLAGTPLLGPLVAAMLALGLMVAVTGMVLPDLAAVTAIPLLGLTELYIAAVSALATLPAAPLFATATPPITLLAAGAVLALGVLAPRPCRLRLAIACGLLCLPHFVPWSPTRAAELRLLDVGHGQAGLAILDDGTRVAVDCGSLPDPRHAAREIVAALPIGRRAIDLLIVSHADADHAGGIAELLQRVPVHRAVLPASMATGPVADRLRRAGIRCDIAPAGAALRPHPDLTVVAPVLPTAASSNDRSLWVRIDTMHGTALLPGDAGPDAIRWALTHPITAPATVLLLPHHGRGLPSSLEPLLRRVQPALVLASTPATPRFPPLVIATRQAGIPVLTTTERGTLTVVFSDPPTVTAERPTPLR